MSKASVPMTYENAKTRALLWAYPQLRRIPRDEWNALLDKAREEDFDLVEWVGIVAGVGLVAYLLRPDADYASAFPLPAWYVVQFVAAVPLLALLVGRFYLRRTRRGLEREIERRRDPRRSDAPGS